MADLRPRHHLDTLGLLCPMPIIKLSQLVKTVESGATIKLLSDDRGILEDLPAWCRSHGHELISLSETAPGEYLGLVRRK